ETLLEGREPHLHVWIILSVSHQHADAPHALPLRPRRKRPYRRIPKSRDEFPPFDHWITSSAVANRVSGMVRRSCLAVLRLMPNSNLVGCSTGRSAGLAPLRILPI